MTTVGARPSLWAGATALLNELADKMEMLAAGLRKLVAVRMSDRFRQTVDNLDVLPIVRIGAQVTEAL